VEQVQDVTQEMKMISDLSGQVSKLETLVADKNAVIQKQNNDLAMSNNKVSVLQELLFASNNRLVEELTVLKTTQQLALSLTERVRTMEQESLVLAEQNKKSLELARSQATVSAQQVVQRAERQRESDAIYEWVCNFFVSYYTDVEMTKRIRDYANGKKTLCGLLSTMFNVAEDNILKSCGIMESASNFDASQKESDPEQRMYILRTHITLYAKKARIVITPKSENSASN
jgi:hypothetical protein